MKAQIYFI